MWTNWLRIVIAAWLNCSQIIWLGMEYRCKKRIIVLNYMINPQAQTTMLTKQAVHRGDWSTQECRKESSCMSSSEREFPIESGLSDLLHHDDLSIASSSISTTHTLSLSSLRPSFLTFAVPYNVSHPPATSTSSSLHCIFIYEQDVRNISVYIYMSICLIFRS